MLNKRFFCVVILIVTIVSTIICQIPTNYYTQIKGLSGKQLKYAPHDIIKDHKHYTYT